MCVCVEKWSAFFFFQHAGKSLYNMDSDMVESTAMGSAMGTLATGTGKVAQKLFARMSTALVFKITTLLITLIGLYLEEIYPDHKLGQAIVQILSLLIVCLLVSILESKFESTH